MNLQTHFTEIAELIKKARFNVIKIVNKELINVYWQVGEYISRKADDENWGKSVVKNLAEYLKQIEPELKGFSAQNIWRMKQFFETYHNDKKLSLLVREISWTNNLIIISRTKSCEEKRFYLDLCIKENLSKRELDRQINTSVFERSKLADKKLSPAVRELPDNAINIFKDSYIFEFLNLPEQHTEKDLQKALIHSLKSFILELGKDFVFMSENFRIQVGNSDFFIDLLFYHRELQCLVAFELKVDKFKPEHLGQLNFYLEALDRDVKKPHENPSVGVLLCKDHDHEVVEYALSRNLSPALVSEYKTKLLDKTLLQQKLHEMFSDRQT